MLAKKIVSKIQTYCPIFTQSHNLSQKNQNLNKMPTRYEKAGKEKLTDFVKKGEKKEHWLHS